MSRPVTKRMSETVQLFINYADFYVAALNTSAARIEATEPGTAAMLRERAQQTAGSALDLIAVWPSEGTE